MFEVQKNQQRSEVCNLVYLSQQFKMCYTSVYVYTLTKLSSGIDQSVFTSQMTCLTKLMMTKGFYNVYSSQMKLHSMSMIVSTGIIVKFGDLNNPMKLLSMTPGSPKVNVWCGSMHDQVIGPFFFIEQTITGHVYLGRAQTNLAKLVFAKALLLRAN